MTRKECLDKAAECVLRDRNNEYGEPEQSFNYIADLWSAYLRTKIEPYDAAAMMALFKLARLRFNAYYEDGWVDLAGYAACGAELAGAEKAREDATGRWGEEYKKLRAEAEAQPEFKYGDKVQACYNEERDIWFDGVVEKVKEGYCYIRRPNGEEISAPKKLIRRQPAEIETGHQFKPGDKVEVHAMTTRDIWEPATVVEDFPDVGLCRVEYADGFRRPMPRSFIRPATKAEGCEELVVNAFSEARMRESMPGIVPQDGPSDFDAPQTKEELYDRIVANNPATFGCAHKPTGEELAEMAEEGAHG